MPRFWSATSAHGQQPPRRVAVALLGFEPDAREVGQFRQGLREAGYTEGRDIAIEVRSAHGNYERVQSMMAEVVRTRPDVIVVENTLTVRAAKNATKTIPIVIAVAADPVGSGLVDSLAQPGGNITGLSMMIAELAAKRFQLLRDANRGALRSQNSRLTPGSGY